MTGVCRLCGGTDLVPSLDLGAQPIVHRMPASADEVEERFPFALHLCRDCGLLQILEPIDPAILYSGFNYNFSSWKPEPHRDAELDSIMAAGPYGSVVEIGCNDGLFLDALRARGIEKAVGVEPNPVAGKIARERGLEVVGGMLDDARCAEVLERHGRFDLLVTRQVTEHVPDLDRFFAGIRALLKDDGLLFLDVPDMGPAADLGDCSVLWEEHVSYFTEPVLRHLLTRQGFQPLRFDRYDFSGGALAVLARRDPAACDLEPEAGDIAMLESFGPKARDYGERLRRALAAARASGAEIALYGVGVRGSTAVNALDLGGSIDFALDDQPERQGMFMPGSKLPIRPGTSLAESERPLVCLLAVNNENDDKVTAKARSLSDRPAIFVSLCGPKDIWAELERLERLPETVGA